MKRHYYIRTFASAAAEKFSEANASLENTKFQRIATVPRHDQNTVRRFIRRHLTETFT